jgi:hypothetical protein
VTDTVVRGSVTVAEMTRRRDRWRAEAARLSRELALSQRIVDRQEYEVREAVRKRDAFHQNEAEARRQLGAALLEARERAIEVGRLRDENRRLVAACEVSDDA